MVKFQIYDEAVREAVIVIWEAADRICGNRLKAAVPHLVDSMERHRHLDLDTEVRKRLLAASAATLDRLLKPVRATAGNRRKRRRRQSMGRRVPVRTYNDWSRDWSRPPPGFLEMAETGQPWNFPDNAPEMPVGYSDEYSVNNRRGFSNG